MEFILPYGTEFIKSTILDKFELILPNKFRGVSDPHSSVKNAIERPLGFINYSIWKNAKKVAIAINDKTRPVPLEYLLPPLLDKLEDFHVDPKAITFIIATGTHKPHNSDELDFVPDLIRNKYRILSHNCDDHDNLTYLGDTSRGTPIWINSTFLSADIRIVVGDIEPHHFMGFSGGAKGAGIGLAGRATINANHAMLIDPCANIGIYLENPIRQDLEEIGDRINIQLVLNAVLNQDKDIVGVFAGTAREVMNAGIPLSMEVCGTRISDRYDIVIASAGGYPKDINLYQAQKAISHATLFTRNGGDIIIIAECIEGSGSEGFDKFINGVNSFSEIEEKFSKTPFQIGPHKAYQLARQASQHSIHLLSSIPHEQVSKYFLNPVNDLNTTIVECLNKYPAEPRIAVIPFATNTLPMTIDNSCK